MISENIPHNWLAPIKAKIAGAARPDFEQSALRVMISGIILAYLAWIGAQDETISATSRQEIVVTLAFFFMACAIATANVYAPGLSKLTRILGIVVDNIIVTYVLLISGESGAALFGTYLFITFGNGFRYGRSYLRLSYVLSAIGFAIVLGSSPFWSQHRSIGVGILTTLIVLPLYVGALAERIKLARQQAEEALRARDAKA